MELYALERLQVKLRGEIIRFSQYLRVGDRFRLMRVTAENHVVSDSGGYLPEPVARVVTVALKPEHIYLKRDFKLLRRLAEALYMLLVYRLVPGEPYEIRMRDIAVQPGGYPLDELIDICPKYPLVLGGRAGVIPSYSLPVKC